MFGLRECAGFVVNGLTLAGREGTDVPVPEEIATSIV